MDVTKVEASQPAIEAPIEPEKKKARTEVSEKKKSPPIPDGVTREQVDIVLRAILAEWHSGRENPYMIYKLSTLWQTWCPPEKKAKWTPMQTNH